MKTKQKKTPLKTPMYLKLNSKDNLLYNSLEKQDKKKQTINQS